MREKVIAAAKELGLELRLANTAQPTRTVDAAATAVGCDAAEIASAEVWVADGDPVVIVLSGGREVDTERVCALLDCAEIRRAGPGEVRSITGFPATSVSPIGHGLPVVMDEELLRHERIWTVGGDSTTLVEVSSRELAERLDATVGDAAGPSRG